VRRLHSWLVVCSALFVFASLAGSAAAAEAGVARFALVVGVNRSVDRDVAELHFADDDAARYFDLFDALGIDTVLLARMDGNTRRVHARAAGKAVDPSVHGVDSGVNDLATRIAAAKKRGARAVFYFVYAGHGNVEHGAGYISLEDGKLTGRDLETRILDKVGADEAHFIVDACQSYFLAYSRGPGGRRRSVTGFSGLGTLGKRPEVGVLLSTSSARESHEWERVQAGVFSHEVRSGLYGAADADGDGSVTYQEIAAFVQRANAAIPNERFRPDVYARPPARGAALLDLKAGLARRIDVEGAQAAHYMVEDRNGVYLAQFHSEAGERVHLVRPRSAGRVYLERIADAKEYVIEEEPDVVSTAGLALAEPRAQARGAAHEAFSKMFELPFGRESVSGFVFRAPVGPDSPAETTSSSTTVRTYAGYGLLGVAGAGAVLGGVSLYVAHHKADDIGSTSSLRDVAERNDEIKTWNITAAVGFGVAGAAAISGAVLLLWPESPVEIDARASEVRARVHGVF
jgi:Caspase domain